MSPRTIAILVPTTSRGRRLRTAADTDLVRVLLPTLLATATWEGTLAYRLYVGYDDGDAFFDTPAGVAGLERAVAARVGDRPLALVLRRCEGTQHSPVAVWNQLFAAAHADGCDFFYQLGDDSRWRHPGGRATSRPRCSSMGRRPASASPVPWTAGTAILAATSSSTC